MEEVEEIVEEFAHMHFPDPAVRNRLKQKICPAADDLDFALEFNVMIEEFARTEEMSQRKASGGDTFTEADTPCFKEQWEKVLKDQWGGAG